MIHWPGSAQGVTEEKQERGNVHLITNDTRTRICPRRTQRVKKEEEKGGKLSFHFPFPHRKFSLYMIKQAHPWGNRGRKGKGGN